jgi:hypothetical protein
MLMSSISTAFFYAQKDKQLVNMLEQHLSEMKRRELITIVHNSVALDDYRLVLLFLSSNFMADNNLVDVMKLVYQQRVNRVIIPIILRDVDLTLYGLKGIICLPRNGKPVARQDKNRAFAEITKDIYKCVTDLL